MKKQMSPISFFSLRIELLLEGKRIGRATGFLYRPAPTEKIFLVTNYHVVTASPPQNPSEILEGYSDCPDELNITLLEKETLIPISIRYSLRKQDNPMWIEHKDRNRGLDIVAIPLELPEKVIAVTQDALNLVDNVNFEIGSDLFIIGFPYGFGAGDFLPIWKRGTVASEPLFKPEGLLRFYIDAFTTPGMSGSPVFAIENRDMFYLDGEADTYFRKYEKGELSALDAIGKIQHDKMHFTKKKVAQLVGIYSGRVVIPDEKNPSIGIVWQKQLIDQMFSEHIMVKHPFPHE
jgi:hypothetical protein